MLVRYFFQPKSDWQPCHAQPLDYFVLISQVLERYGRTYSYVNLYTYAFYKTYHHIYTQWNQSIFLIAKTTSVVLEDIFD